MKVYKDIFSGDEFISDSYPSNDPFDDSELHDIAFEVKTSRISKTNDFGIADNSEEGEDKIENSDETVVDVIDTFNLSETFFSDKKDFALYLKEYMRKLLKHLEEANPTRVETFKGKSNLLAKKLLSMYDDLQFYMGSSMDMSCGLAYAYFKDAELTPRLIFIKDGMKEEKF